MQDTLETKIAACARHWHHTPETIVHERESDLLGRYLRGELRYMPDYDGIQWHLICLDLEMGDFDLLPKLAYHISARDDLTPEMIKRAAELMRCLAESALTFNLQQADVADELLEAAELV